MFSYDLGTGGNLRVVHETDAEEMFAAVDANRAHLGQWMQWIDKIASVADEIAYIKRSRQRYAEFGEFDTVICQDGKIAGGMGFVRTDVLNRHTEIGYWVAANMQGRGLVTRGVRALLDYALGQWKMHRVEIHCAPENKRSRAVPERLGFTNEGTLRQAQIFHEGWLDHVIYAMLEQDWPAARAATLQKR